MVGKSLVICPVYNEEETIEIFFQELRRHYRGDVVFVDDGSADKSKGFLSRVKDNNTFLIRHPRRAGYGQALLSGFSLALRQGYARIVTLDADLQHNPEHIPRFLSQLLGYDVVLGSRYIRIDKYFDAPRKRLVINRYVCGLFKTLFSADITDAFCGYRGYKASFLEKALLGEKSYGLALEILLEVVDKRIAFKEIPIEALYFNPQRRFLDGLDDPRERLLYYLDIIARRVVRVKDEEKVLSSSPAS